MIQTEQEIRCQAVAWLQQFLHELEGDTDIIDAKPIEAVRTELAGMGADVAGFHTRLVNTLRLAQLKQIGKTLIKWISPEWSPQWAGQVVTAGDIPDQHHTFETEQGSIDMSCSWKPQTDEMSPYLELSWRMDLVMEGELWCQFIHPDTREILGEVRLGPYTEGGKYLSSQTLGFDPSRVPWTLSMLIKDHKA